MPTIGTHKLSCATLSPATAAEAVPIPLAEVESEIFAEAEAPLCDICHIQISEKNAVKGLCETCSEYVDEGIKEYTEEFALASVHGKDAVRLFVLRQRADNCREICDTYHCDKSCCESLPILPEVQEAKRDEELVNKLAAECLARLPASFAPWWRDAWTYEKWWQVYDERKVAGWPLASADVPIVQRLAAATVAKEDKIHEMKKAHAEVLANIERARKEDMEAVEARHQREITELHKNLQDEMDAVDALRKGPQAMRADLERLTAENKELWQQIEEDKQMVQRHLKEIAKEHAQMTAWEKKEIERLTEENKKLEHRVAEESHLCKRANLATRTAEMHAQMLRTDVAELEKENEGLRKLVFPSLNLQAASSGVKLEPELAPKLATQLAPRITQVVQASPELVAALKAEKTWEAGTDICYALTKKDYEDMIKAKGALPSVEVVEPDARLELLQKMVDCPLPDQLMECGSYECPPVQTEPEPVPEVKAKRPNYNHPNWPSPTTKRFAKHVAKHSGQTDPKAIKTHEEALEFIAKRAKVSVETLLNMSLKAYQSAHEPWSLVQDPWSPPNSLYFHCEL
jgi:hypothetical protein